MSIPLQIFHHSSLSWHITPLKILSSYIFCFAQKDPIKVPILTLSSALVKICQISHVIFQTTSQFLLHSSVSWKITLYTFSDQTLHTLHKRNQSKCKFLSLSSTRVKIYQILVIFERPNQFFAKFCVTINITSLYLFSWSFIYFQQKEPIKVQIWWNFTWE